MRTRRVHASRIWVLLVVAAAVAGLLAMHGFEAIGADFAVDHGATPIMSVAQDHSDACSPDIPHAAVMKVRPVCPFAVSFPSLINNTLAAAAHVPSNREVLTAFSILVV